MSIKDWNWLNWVLVISILLLLILGSVLVYALLKPDTFITQKPTDEQPYNITGLPTSLEGAPDRPASPIEDIPLFEIQGLDTQAGIDIIAQGGITQISDIANFEVDHISLNPSGDGMNYYDPQTSRFYRIDEDGALTKISDQVFAEVETVTWADNAKDAVLEFPDGSNVVYNFETEDQVTLPEHWTDFDFAPNSNNIAFKSLALDPDERWLAVADKNGSSARRIAHLGENEDVLTVDWSPNNQVVGTYSEPDGLTRSEVFFVGFNNENFPLTKIHGLKFEGKWMPSGKQLLYSSIHSDSDFNPNLWIVDGTGSNMGSNRQRIGLPTWTHKCTAASDTKIYCGVPSYLPRGAGLAPSIADDISDNIYEIDLETGTQSLLAIPAEDINVKQMRVSNDGKSLYVHDNFSGGLKKIQID